MPHFRPQVFVDMAQMVLALSRIQHMRDQTFKAQEKAQGELPTRTAQTQPARLRPLVPSKNLHEDARHDIHEVSSPSVPLGNQKPSGTEPHFQVAEYIQPARINVQSHVHSPASIPAQSS